MNIFNYFFDLTSILTFDSLIEHTIINPDGLEPNWKQIMF
jgi:hypothetical protein